MQVDLPQNCPHFDAWRKVTPKFWGAPWKTVQDNLPQYPSNECNPAPENVFRALCLTPPDAVKVVILGMDPYPQQGRATGLAFSFPAGHPPKDALCKINAELRRDTGQLRQDGNLEDWAAQGVLLLNSCLTVRDGQAGSHINRIGWEKLTQEMLGVLAKAKNIYFLIWGRKAFKVFNAAWPDGAKSKRCTISGHPRASIGFKENDIVFDRFYAIKPFSKANGWLKDQKIPPINWAGPNPAPPA